MTYKVGIIGRGFVGGAIESYLKDKCDVVSYDIRDSLDADQGYKNVVDHSEIIYVCVPTPQNSDGSFCKDILEQSIRLIDFHAAQKSTQPIVVIKSTMSPGTFDDLYNIYKNIEMVVNPEFLTERTAKKDVQNTKKHLIGGYSINAAYPVMEFIWSMWPSTDCFYVEPTEAELIKYITNSFFAVKVSFANHIHDLCESLGIDYESISDTMIQVDPRVGDLHWKVPGPDGKLGFGGRCFPKDLNGMIELFDKLELDCDVLSAAQNYNLKIRD